MPPHCTAGGWNAFCEDRISIVAKDYAVLRREKKRIIVLLGIVCCGNKKVQAMEACKRRGLEVDCSKEVYHVLEAVPYIFMAMVDLN